MPAVNGRNLTREEARTLLNEIREEEGELAAINGAGIGVYIILNSKDKEKFDKIRNVEKLNKCRVREIEGKELYLIKKKGLCNGRANEEDGHYIYISKDGKHIYYRYVNTWDKTVWDLIELKDPLIEEALVGKGIKWEYNGVHCNEKKAYWNHERYSIEIEFPGEDTSLKDIDGNVIEVGDYVISATRSYGGACLVRGTVTKINQFSVKLDDETCVSSVYILKKGDSK